MYSARLLLAVVFAAATMSSVSAAPAECDRACLKTTLDQYLKAVTAHNPAAAPLFIGYRHTENAVVQKLGEGAWKSVTGIGKADRRYYDAVSGQAAFFGVLNEGAAIEALAEATQPAMSVTVTA